MGERRRRRLRGLGGSSRGSSRGWVARSRPGTAAAAAAAPLSCPVASGWEEALRGFESGPRQREHQIGGGALTPEGPPLGFRGGGG